MSSLRRRRDDNLLERPSSFLVPMLERGIVKPMRRMIMLNALESLSSSGRRGIAFAFVSADAAAMLDFIAYQRHQSAAVLPIALYAAAS